jgi:hypothetical protein
LTSPAHAADPKKKKSSGDSLTDDKVIGKQLQWEDSVMGPDDKRAELDKIARAQAINKAAAEKAARDKEKADAEAAKRAEQEAKAPKKQQKSGEVALPTLPDEEPANGKKGKTSEISPKLDTAAAAAPPPPQKPADDKFIDKLLKDEGSSGKKKKATADNKDLLELIGSDKSATTPTKTKGRKDNVDSLLLEADKAPAVDTTPKKKKELAEWEKPEIQATAPAPAPVISRPAPKRDDGIIHVVQGAAGTSSAPAARPAPAPTRTTAIASRTTSTPLGNGRKQPAAGRSGGGNWDDPFADPTSAPKRKTVAAASRANLDDDDITPTPPPRRTNVVPASNRQPARATRSSSSNDDWADPFTDRSRKPAPANNNAGGNRRVAPAANKPAKSGPSKQRWDDPFTEDAPAKATTKVAARAAAPSHATVATREPAKSEASAEPTSKWQLATKHTSTTPAAASPAPSASHGGWGVLKKRR